MKYIFNRTKSKSQVYLDNELDKMFLGLANLKFKKEIFSIFSESYSNRSSNNNSHWIDVEVEKGKTRKSISREKKLVPFGSDTVIVFSYSAIDDRGMLPQGLEFKLSVHLENEKAFLKHKIVNKNNYNAKYDYALFLSQDNQSSSMEFCSKPMDANELFKKINHAFFLTTRENPNLKISSNNTRRAVFLKLLERDFDLKIFPTDTNDIKQEKELVPLNVCEKKLTEHYQKIYAVEELQQALEAVKNKYQPLVQEEKNKLKVNDLEKNVAILSEKLNSNKPLLKGVSDEFSKIKSSWAKEKLNIEKACGDDLLKMDEMYQASIVRKEAIEFSERVKKMNDEQKNIENELNLAMNDLKESSKALKVTPIFNEKVKYISGLIVAAENKVKSSVDGEIAKRNHLPANVLDSDDFKKSYFYNFNTNMDVAVKKFMNLMDDKVTKKRTVRPK